MTNLALLAEKINVSGITKTALARKANLSRETFYNRLAGKGEFKASEIHLLTLALHLTPKERDEIFFGNKGECNSHSKELNHENGKHTNC